MTTKTQSIFYEFCNLKKHSPKEFYKQGVLKFKILQNLLENRVRIYNTMIQETKTLLFSREFC